MYHTFDFKIGQHMASSKQHLFAALGVFVESSYQLNDCILQSNVDIQSKLTEQLISLFNLTSLCISFKNTNINIFIKKLF